MTISAKNITKRYGSQLALDHISFEVKEREIFGFIGPDGAGKTTLFRILTTVLKPDEGEAEVAGHSITDYRSIRRIVGYMPGRFSLYQDLSVEENLKFFATIFGTTIKENYDIIKDIYQQIEPFKDRLAGKLSGGMKQKLALSCALIHKPQVLFLDEPTTGVDPVSRKEFWDILHRLKEQGITILVSTPYMDEAALCDRVALIQKGKILNIDEPQQITKEFSGKLIAIRTPHPYHVLQLMRQYEHHQRIYPFGDALHYLDQRENVKPEDIRQYLNKNDEEAEVEIIEPTIEDVFISLMQEEKMEEAK